MDKSPGQAEPAGYISICGDEIALSLTSPQRERLLQHDGAAVYLTLQATAPQPSVGEQADKRALFEAWARKVGYNVDAEGDHAYSATFANVAWEAWQAARAPSPSRDEAPAAQTVERFRAECAEATRALKTYEAPAAQAGCKLVPLEPTEEMREACKHLAYQTHIDEDWAAMLAAAPAASVARDEDAKDAARYRYLKATTTAIRDPETGEREECSPDQFEQAIDAALSSTQHSAEKHGKD